MSFANCSEASCIHQPGGSQDEPLKLINFVHSSETNKWSFGLNHRAISTIVKRAGSRPLSIVSICGPPRSGKTFLFGYLIRYLSSLECQKTGWFGWDDKDKPLEGFEQSKLETQGIFVWSRPFIIKTEDGSEVAVLLVDTHYDLASSKETAAVITGLSVLTSSIMIFNCLSTSSPEEFYSSLYIYTEFGKLAEQIDNEKHFFQKLLVLVRDWNNIDEYPYGLQGGRRFLHQNLTKYCQSQEPNMPGIENFVEDIQCCLMPSPGMKIVSPDYKGSVGELEPKFAKRLEQLIEALISKDDMVPREVFGLFITATDLKDILQMYLAVFNSKEELSPTLLFEKTGHFYNEKVLKKAIAKMVDVSKRKMRGRPYIGTDEIDEALKTGEKAANDVFQRESKFSSKRGKVRGKAKLQVCLRGEMDILTKTNNDNRDNYIRKVTADTITNFKSALNAKLPLSVDHFYEDLYIITTIAKVKNQLVEEFKEKVDNESKEGLTESLKSLEASMDTISSDIVNTNSASRAEATGVFDSWFRELKEKVGNVVAGKKARSVSTALGNLDSVIAPALEEFKTKKKPVQNVIKTLPRATKQSIPVASQFGSTSYDEVRIIVENHKREYSQQCEVIWSKFFDAVEVNSLIKLHTAMCDEVKSSLRTQLSQLMTVEAVECELALLHTHINNYRLIAMDGKRVKAPVEEKADKCPVCAEIVLENQVQTYNDKMKDFVGTSPVLPEHLADLHKNLFHALSTQFRGSCCLELHANRTNESLQTLQQQLSEAYKGYCNSNQEKIINMRQAAEKVVVKYKAEYNIKCKKIVKQFNTVGWDLQILTKQHQALSSEVKKMLEMELRGKMCLGEPLEVHQLSLQNYIDAYWKNTMDVHRKNWEIKRKHYVARQNVGEKWEVPAAVSLQGKPNRKREREAKSFDCNYGNSFSHEIYMPIATDPDKNLALPPLVLYFQSTNILMGMNGISEVIPNHLKETNTPAFVVVTPDGRIQYGSEALTLFETQSLAQSPHGGCYWSIADLFLMPDRHINKEIYINRQKRTITHEFLLGYIFRKLKEIVEGQMKGVCTQTLIVVPFWLSSTQRFRVQNAAKLAGFSQVYLVNEAVAAAYNFLLDTDRLHPGGVLTFVENLDRVDAFMYECNPSKKTVRMVCHKRAYPNNNQEDSLVQTLINGNPSIKLFEVATAYLPYRGPTDETKIKSLRQACKQAISRSKNSNWEVLYICGNERKWGVLMNHVLVEFSRTGVVINEKTAALTGAISLSNNLSQVGPSVCDKLIADVSLRNGITSTGNYSVIISRNDCLPEIAQEFKAKLPSAHGHLNVQLYQEICGSIHNIGSLNVRQAKPGESLQVKVQVTNEGIVTFNELLTGHTGGNNLFQPNSFLTLERFTWKPVMLTPEELDEQFILLQLVWDTDTDSKLIQAKETLLKKL